MNLSRYINEHMEDILVEWEAFARKLEPAADGMSDLALRDHAKQILEAIAADIRTPQTGQQQHEKSEGLAPQEAKDSAASIHGALRHDSDFSVVQLCAEFRALRATVLRRWLPQVQSISADATDEMVRFNEAIDQALAESLATFSARSESTRDLFLAVLGHDLRVPLASMAAAGELLKHPGTGLEAMKDVGTRVSRGAALMSRMVEDLVEYTRTQLGSRMPVSLQELDVGEACTRAVADASAAFPRSRFEIDVKGKLRGCFDEVRLHQLLTNLLTNAAQYGSEEEPVTIASQAEADDIVVRVMNHGAPIPETSWRSIFEPLVQLQADHENGARPKTSLGLGLFVAREIAIAHGGDISVDSTMARGTTFTVRLPGPLLASS